MTKKELLKINVLYDYEHGLDDADVEMANKYINYIESTRDKKHPQTGDIIRYTTKYGDFYAKAHIDNQNDENSFAVCLSPYIPFISSINEGLKLSTSGGPWKSVKTCDLKYIGTAKKMFCDFGSCGWCANGAVNFEATVNVWEYTENDLLYGEYTTEYYKKMSIRKLDEPSDFGYMIIGEGVAFKDEKDYQAFLKTYKAKVFTNPNPKTETIFMYKEINQLLSFNEWEQLKNCQIDTRLCNGSIITVKVQYNDCNKTVTVYRYSNCFEKADEIANKPYILNR